MWQDEFGSFNLGPNISVQECYSYRLGADTTVNDTAYRTLLMSGSLFHYQSEPPYNNYSLWYAGSPILLLREDTIARQVYVRPPGWPFEELLYDFSVGLGPYPLTYRHSYPGSEVTAVDTVFLSDGPHRRITLDGYEEIVEGIGSLSGFLSGSDFGMMWLSRLVCHTLAGAENYGIPSTDCPCGFAGIPTHKARDVQIGPSPTADLCYLTGGQPNALFRIQSIEGRIVCKGQCSESGSATIDMTNLPGGLYVIEVLGPFGPHSLKVIKE